MLCTIRYLNLERRVFLFRQISGDGGISYDTWHLQLTYDDMRIYWGYWESNQTFIQNYSRTVDLVRLMAVGILGHIGSGGPQDPNSGRVGNKRVQMSFQPNNVLNKPEWTRFWVGLGPQCSNLGWIGSGWASRVQIRAESGRGGWNHLAALNSLLASHNLWKCSKYIFCLFVCLFPSAYFYAVNKYHDVVSCLITFKLTLIIHTNTFAEK